MIYVVQNQTPYITEMEQNRVDKFTYTKLLQLFFQQVLATMEENTVFLINMSLKQENISGTVPQLVG